jgi:hypothetical protein
VAARSAGWIRSGPSAAGRSARRLQQGDDAGRATLTLLIAALVLAVLELFMARWFSHAVTRTGAAA